VNWAGQAHWREEIVKQEAALEGRVALVTGGSRGIGRGIALALAEDGADVAVNYRRDEDAAHETVAAIESAGRRAGAYQASVDDFEADRAMVEAVARDLGPVDILVNNAGIASRGNTVERTDPAELERVVRLHALAPHRLCQLVIPGMKDRPRGDIVMISSVHHGIHVNVVAPGLVETEMGRRLARATAGVEDLRQLDAQSPFGRVCQPEDVANAVRFLVSERSSYLTGEKINVHGGGPLSGAM
jgi:NAD(P)-dependent dehydrogenase (short-subunit alcohol dehydrogenase family)